MKARLLFGCNSSCIVYGDFGLIDVSYCCQRRYLRTYVADVVLCNPIDVPLAVFASQQDIRSSIRVKRAIMKKYSGASGSGQRKFDAAMRQLRALETKVAQFDVQLNALAVHSSEVCYAMLL